MHRLTLLSLLLLSLSLAYSAVDPNKSPLVSTETVRATKLFDLLTYPARITSNVNASILSETEGVVRKILAPLGTKVRKSEKLLTLTNTDPIYNYAPISVTASVAGVVSKIDVTEGSRVTKGQLVAQITDPTQVRVDVEVAVSDLSAVSTGLEGELRIPAYQETFRVKVSGVSPFVDPATGTATAQLALLDKDGKAVSLPPGLVGQVSFKAHEHDGLQVPEYAVFYHGKDPFVRGVKDGKARFVPVVLGPTRRGLIEILKGLQESETIVVRANKYVADGEEIEVQKPQGE